MSVTPGGWPSAADGPTSRDMLELEAIRARWGMAYTVGYTIKYHAIRKTGGHSVSASSPEGLDSAIRANWTRDWDGERVTPSGPPWDVL